MRTTPLTQAMRRNLNTLFFVSCALVSLSLSVTGKKRRKTKSR